MLILNLGTVTTATGPSSLANAILNPSTFYTNRGDWCSTSNDAFWGGADKTLSVSAVKTMFDPSPAGWRVPTWKGLASPWTAFTTSTFSWNATDHGRTYTDGSFYPAAGYRNSSSGALQSVASLVGYWSGSPSGSNGYNLVFDSSNVYPAGNNYRAYGFSVRCVQE